MTNEAFNRTLKIVTSVTAMFLLASALLWVTVQHIAYLSAQTEAVRLQTAAMTALSQINAERLEVNRQVWLSQQKMLQALDRIDQRQQREARPDGLCFLRS